MKTPEEIAREAADVFRRHLKETSTGYWYDSYASSIVSKVEPHIIAAIETALRQCPVPSPVSEERMAEIRRHWGDCPPIDIPLHEVSVILDLLAHIDHLHRIFTGPEAEAFQSMYEQGKAAGYREGHRTGWEDGVRAQYGKPMLYPENYEEPTD